MATLCMQTSRRKRRSSPTKERVFTTITLLRDRTSAYNSWTPHIGIKSNSKHKQRHPFDRGPSSTDEQNCGSDGFMTAIPRDHNTDCVFVKIVARYAILANTTFHQTLASISAEGAKFA